MSQTTRKPSLTRELARIATSEDTASQLYEAATRLADLAEGNEVVADEVRRLRSMAMEYDADADCARESLMESFSWEQIEAAL